MPAAHNTLAAQRIACANFAAETDTQQQAMKAYIIRQIPYRFNDRALSSIISNCEPSRFPRSSSKVLLLKQGVLLTSKVNGS